MRNDMVRFCGSTSTEAHTSHPLRDHDRSHDQGRWCQCSHRTVAVQHSCPSKNHRQVDLQGVLRPILHIPITIPRCNRHVGLKEDPRQMNRAQCAAPAAPPPSTTNFSISTNRSIASEIWRSVTVTFLSTCLLATLNAFVPTCVAQDMRVWLAGGIARK